jgi:hypothetical protein
MAEHTIEEKKNRRFVNTGFRVTHSINEDLLNIKRVRLSSHINKILAKAHFNCRFFLNDAKKQHIFAETGLYEDVGILPVMPPLLPHVL